MSGDAPVRALVLCGGGRHSDRWHDLAGTGQAVAGLLDGLGVQATLTSRLIDVVADSRFDTDLLVVNSSQSARDPEAADPDDPREDLQPFAAALDAHVAAGRPVLALHSSTLAFPDVPRWAEVLGARWRERVTMHPDLGPTVVQLHPAAHPLAAGLTDVSVEDERYSLLELVEDLGAVVPYLTHEHAGVTHPLAWAREVGPARARVVYDALGHDARSYRSGSRRELFAAEVRWLLGHRTGR